MVQFFLGEPNQALINNGVRHDLGGRDREALARVFWESVPYCEELFVFMNFAEEENDCKVFIVKPVCLSCGSSQQQALHTVTREFFEVGTPREEREEPKGLGPAIN